MNVTQAKQILYTILSKYVSQESIDEVWQEVKEAGIFSGQGDDGMNYEKALERAKSRPVMRPQWKQRWLTFENGRHLELYDDGSVHEWCPLHPDMAATDWIDAPRSPDEP